MALISHDVDRPDAVSPVETARGDARRAARRHRASMRRPLCCIRSGRRQTAFPLRAPSVGANGHGHRGAGALCSSALYSVYRRRRCRAVRPNGDRQEKTACPAPQETKSATIYPQILPSSVSQWESIPLRQLINCRCDTNGSVPRPRKPAFERSSPRLRRKNATPDLLSNRKSRAPCRAMKMRRRLRTAKPVFLKVLKSPARTPRFRRSSKIRRRKIQRAARVRSRLWEGPIERPSRHAMRGLRLSRRD